MSCFLPVPPLRADYQQPVPALPQTSDAADHRPVVAFGPELPETGSWQWNGQAMADALRDRCEIRLFHDEIPECDVAVIVKYRPSAEQIHAAARRSALVWMPVDVYGTAAEIDRDAAFLRLCDRTLIHCQRLRGYLQSYTPCEDMDHCLMAAVDPDTGSTATRRAADPEAPVLWTGRQTNLRPLVEWVNTHGLPRPLRVLTDVGPDQCDPGRFGFRGPQPVTVEPWSIDRHRAAVATAAGAIDIKGTSFRQRHKPPTKATDAIAAGLPLAMNPGSSPVEYLAGHGFEVCAPEDTDRWFSREYHQQTLDCGRMLRAHLSPARVADRLFAVITEVLAERSRR